MMATKAKKQTPKHEKQIEDVEGLEHGVPTAPHLSDFYTDPEVDAHIETEEAEEATEQFESSSSVFTSDATTCDSQDAKEISNASESIETTPQVPQAEVKVPVFDPGKVVDIVSNANLYAPLAAQVSAMTIASTIQASAPPPMVLESVYDPGQVEHEEVLPHQSQVSYETIQPFTEAQLRGLYRNSELLRAAEYVDEFLVAESETSNDPFYQLVFEYQRSRLALLNNEKSFQKLKVAAEEEKMKVWTLHDQQVENEAECQDGKRVVSIHRYQVAEFNASSALNLTRANKELRELLFEDVSLHLFRSNLNRLRVEESIQNVCCSDHIDVTRVKKSISVLFSFLRMRNDDEKFVRDLRFWLEQFVATLLQKLDPNFEHHLFLLNHVLRCPAGFGRWAASFIQPPAPCWSSYSEDIDFDNPELSQLLALISILLSPVKGRQEFLPEFSVDFHRSPDQSPLSEDVWTVLDSDGEEDDASLLSHSRPPMRENDLVAVFNQMPIDSMFRYLLKVEKRDNSDIYNPANFSVTSFMKLFAFGTQFIQLLREGLNTFDAPSYRQFAKRIGRLVRHTVQYCSDHWQAYLQSSGPNLDPAMCQRIQVEHDNFFMRAVKCIFSSKKLGMWQYLAVIPYGTLSQDMLWRIYYILHFINDQEANDEENIENLHSIDWREIKLSLDSTDVKTHFSDALEVIASTERLFLLTAFANMATARKDTDQYFIEHVCLELIEIGFLTVSTFETCCKGARDLLSDVAKIHPWVMSFLIRQMEKSLDLMGLGKNCLYLFKELPFSLWRPEDEEIFFVVCRWLIDFPPTSSESQLSRLILGKMNWTIEEEGDGLSVRPLGWTFHRTLALTIVESNLKHAPDIVQETGILQEGVRQMSNLAASLYKKSPEQNLNAWSWEMVSRLRLHATDQSDVETRAFLQGHVTLHALDLEVDYPGLASSVAAKSPLACFVALQLSQIGHRPADILEAGLAQLQFLTLNGRYDHVMEVLLNIAPIFITNQEQFWSNDVLKRIVDTIVNADQTYFKMAKDLIAAEFPGPVLKEFGNLLLKQLLSFKRYGLDDPIPLMELWLRTLINLPNWSSNRNILFLIDLICKNAFMYPERRSKIGKIFSEILEDLRSKANGGLFSWRSGNKSGVSLLPPSSSEFSWFSFVALEVEESSQIFISTWQPLVTELSIHSENTNIEKSLKVVASQTNTQTYNSNCLPIYKWSQIILDTPVDHPLQPIFAQKFFSYFLARPTPQQSGVGKKFFEGIVNSLYFGRLQTKLKGIADHYESTKPSEVSNLVHFFRASLLWTEESIVLDSSLHIPSLGPNFLPEKVSLLIHKSEDLWFELMNSENLRESEEKCVSEWNNLHFRSQLASTGLSSTRPRLNSASLKPSERITRRLRSNDCPTPLPPFCPPSVHLFSFSDKMLTNPTDLKRSLNPIVGTIKEFSRLFNENKLECGALIGAMTEMVEGLYVNLASEVYAKASCLGSVGQKGQKLACSGSAMVRHKFKEAKKQEVPDHQLSLKRDAFERLCHSMLFQPPPQKVLSSVILLENATEYIVKMYQRYSNGPTSSEGFQMYSSLASTLFYLIVDDCLSEEVSNCPALRYSISSCLESLGESVIVHKASECTAVLRRLTSRPALAPSLSPFFCPNLADSSTFVEVYKEVSQLSDSDANLAFVLLSKVSVDGWIDRCRPIPNEKSRLISLLGKAFHRSGLEPKPERTLLHGLHRRHLMRLTMCDFPEHFGEVLGLLLILTERQSLDPEIWLDVVDALTKEDVQFRLPEDPNLWEEKCLAFSSQQMHIQLEEVLEFTRIMTSHFNKERRNVGLHGLYTKYQKYVKPLAANLCLQSNLLVTLMLKQDRGTPADSLVVSIWNHLMSLFDAWLTPLHDHQRQETAAWIQQLAASQKLLLPWAPGDVKWASIMATAQAKCVALLHFTVPASKSALSHYWEHYCRHYAHPAIKDYILVLVHETLLNCLPWNTFYPRTEDLKLMVSIMDSFLPLCHEFLGRIFVDIPWSELFRRNPEALPRVISPLLHIAVKLAAEPQVRLSGQLLCLLRDAAVNLPWSYVDANTFENLIQWYIMSVDCKVILNHEQRHPLDSCVLNLLRQASSLIPTTNQDVNPEHQNSVPTDLRKAQVFVRCKARLLISCGNKQKSFLSNQLSPLRLAVQQLIQDVHYIVSLVNPSKKSSNSNEPLVRELLGLLNANTMSLLPETTLESLLSFLAVAGGRSESIELLNTLLRITASSVNDPQRVAKLMEGILEAVFQDQTDGSDGDEVRRTDWQTVLTHTTLPSPDKLRLVLDQCVTSGCCLYIFACLRKKRRQSQSIQDEQVLVSSLLDWMRHLKLSEKCESKLPLLYSEFLLLCCRQLECGVHTSAVTKNVLDFLSILSPLALCPGTTWNILGAIGLSSQYKPTPRGRFLALAVSFYLRSQIVKGPTLRTATEQQNEEMQGFENTLNYYEESELIKLRESLDGLRQTQAYLGLLDMLDWVLEMTANKQNTFEASQQFLEFLVVDNIYTEHYLVTSSSNPSSPYRAMGGLENI